MALSRPVHGFESRRERHVESRTGADKSLIDLRFQSPLIEPDMRISRIRLSDKTSCVRPRKGLGSGFELHEP